jgi:hypothetical protein
MPREWSPRRALAFVEKHGVVLESGRGPVPALAQAVAGHAFRGNWWGHPKRREIFQATRAVRDSSDVLVCRLIDGKITYVHRRVWPVLVRLARFVDGSRLAAIREEHTSSGSHRLVTVAYPQWVPPEVRTAAEALPESEALERFDAWLIPEGRASKQTNNKEGKVAAARRTSRDA